MFHVTKKWPHPNLLFCQTKSSYKKIETRSLIFHMHILVMLWCFHRIERSLSLLYAMRNYLLFYIVLKGLHPGSRIIVMAIQEAKMPKNGNKISQKHM